MKNNNNIHTEKTSIGNKSNTSNIDWVEEEFGKQKSSNKRKTNSKKNVKKPK